MGWIDLDFATCRRLMEAGVDEARFYVGYHYWLGTDGVEMDAAEAVRIWEDGKLSHDYKAQHMIGLCHRNGMAGFQRNEREANRWFERSADGLLHQAMSGDKFAETLYMSWLMHERRKRARF